VVVYKEQTLRGARRETVGLAGVDRLLARLAGAREGPVPVHAVVIPEFLTGQRGRKGINAYLGIVPPSSRPAVSSSPPSSRSTCSRL
jgi:hypothetical protein